MITNITIKNIKGYGNPATSIDLELKPNRVNILYAPNGSGKSSIATAFKALRAGGIALSKNDYHHKDETLPPELSIVLDSVTYKANSTSNAISPVIETYVINSGTVVSTTQQNIGGRYTRVNGFLDIENIVVIDRIPPSVTLRYLVSEIKRSFGINGKILENRTPVFSNPQFWKACEDVGYSLDLFPRAQFRKDLINDVISKIQAIEGTADYVKSQIPDHWFIKLEADPTYGTIMQALTPFTEGMNELSRFDLFYQLLFFWAQNRNEIRKANKRTLYNEWRLRFDENLALLDTTWKNIRSVEEDDRLIVQFPHADEISNGQRDILTLVVELLKFKSQIKKGRKYLLIIDEVFDYLDDANTITAQFFLTNLLELNKGNMYLCMFTHLNPFSFKNYIFSDKKVNFSYLLPTRPIATEAMKAFISFREGLNNNDPTQRSLYDDLSHDLFHYNPVIVDYSSRIHALSNNASLRSSWGKTAVLHQVLVDEVNKYLSGNQVYDPYAVAMALRLRVEKIVYDKLGTLAQKNGFVAENMTKRKFSYAEENGVAVPDMYNVVNAIHNEADHLKYDAVSHQYLEKSMVYKLQNNVILGMLREIFGWGGNSLDKTVIE